MRFSKILMFLLLSMLLFSGCSNSIDSNNRQSDNKQSDKKQESSSSYEDKIYVKGSIHENIDKIKKYEDLPILKPEIDQQFIEAARKYDKELMKLIYTVDNIGINNSNVKEIQDKAHDILLGAEYRVCFPYRYRLKNKNDKEYDEKRNNEFVHSTEMLGCQMGLGKMIFFLCAVHNGAKHYGNVSEYYKEKRDKYLKIRTK